MRCYGCTDVNATCIKIGIKQACRGCSRKKVTCEFETADFIILDKNGKETNATSIPVLALPQEKQYLYNFARRPEPALFPGAFIITLHSEYPSMIVTLLNKLRSKVRIVSKAFLGPPITFTTNGNILDEYNSFFSRSNFSDWFFGSGLELGKHVTARFRCERQGCQRVKEVTFDQLPLYFSTASNTFHYKERYADHSNSPSADVEPGYIQRKLSVNSYGMSDKQVLARVTRRRAFPGFDHTNFPHLQDDKLSSTLCYCCISIYASFSFLSISWFDLLCAL